MNRADKAEAGVRKLLEENREQWAEAYPHADLDLEVEKMVAWIRGNPMKAPRVQYGRFAVSWLTWRPQRRKKQGSVFSPAGEATIRNVEAMFREKDSGEARPKRIRTDDDSDG